MESVNKNTHSQDEMINILSIKFIDCIKELSEIQETEGIPNGGLTAMIAKIGMDNKHWNLTIEITPTV